MSRIRKPATEEAEVFQHGFTRIPAFWIDQLFALGDGIPPMFWKFLLTVWRDVCDPNRRFKCVKTMTQFDGIGKTAAMKWTAALWASCLFDVEYGQRHVSNLPGSPTVIRYRLRCTLVEWICFIEGLRNAVHKAKENNDDTNDIEPFKIQLTFCIAERRKEAGLPIDECKRRVDEWVADGRIELENNGYRWLRRETDRRRVLNADNAELKAFGAG